jgi:uncharacterized membrane protein YhaH (DUF805 family)
MKEQLKNFFNIRNFFTFSGRVTGFQVLASIVTWCALFFVELLVLNILTGFLYGRALIPLHYVYDFIFTNSFSPPDFSCFPGGFCMMLWFLVKLQVTLRCFSGISFLIRRLHDLNLQKWWVFLVMFLEVFYHFMTGLSALSISFFFWTLLLIPGTKGENRFGPAVV